MQKGNSDDYLTIFESLVDVLTCGICLGVLENPKQLICNHFFCCECIMNILTTRSYGDIDFGKYLTCPMCSKITIIGEDGPHKFLDSIPRNYQLEKMCDLIRNSACASTTDTPPCLEMTNDSDPNLIEEELKYKFCNTWCRSHNKNLLKYFCNDCEELMCRVCEIVGHREHKILDICDIYKKQKKLFMDLLETNKNNQILIKDSVRHIDATIENLKQCEEDIVRKINEKVQERINEITEMGNDLKDRLYKGIRLKLKKLDVQKDVLEMELGKMVYLESVSQKFISQDDSIKILNLKHHLKDLCSEFQVLKLDPEEDDSIIFKKNDSRLNENGSKNFIGSVQIFSTYAELSFASGDGIKNAIVNERQCFQVITMDRFGNSIAVNKNLQINVTSSNNHLLDTNVSIKDHHDGSYLVSYTPKVIGKHTIEVTIGDCAIKGSPFYVNAFAKRDYEMEKSVQPFKIGAYGTKVKEFKSPLGVTSNNNNEIFVCDSYNHRLQVLGRRGEQLGVFGSHGQKLGNFSCPSGIGTNADGSLIVVSELTNNRVQLFNRETISTSLDRETFLLKPKGFFGKEGCSPGCFRSPMGVCFNNCGDKFFICDRENARIQLMSTEGLFSDCLFPRADKNRFCPVYCAYESFKNQLYVTDSKNNLIHIFDHRQGSKPIYTISHLYNTLTETMLTPKGIDFDLMGNLVVSDSGNCRIIVCKSDGNVVAEFPSTTNATNNLFKSPEDISVLSCGKIVVTDILNHQIVSF